jgi:L-fuculose-phosphate aldolase
MNIKKIICLYSRYLGRKDLFFGASGNMSVRDGNRIYITKTGSIKPLLSENEISIFDTKKNRPTNGVEPSSEIDVHKLIYSLNKRAKCIIHTHSLFSTIIFEGAFKINGLGNLEQALYLRNIAYVPLEMPTTKEAEKSIRSMGGYFDIYVLRGHGIIALGESVKQACIKAELFEKTCSQIYYSKQFYGKITYIDNFDEKKYRNLKKMKIRLGERL